MGRKRVFDDARRVVIKIGTQVLTREGNRLDSSVMEHLVEQVCHLIEQRGKEVVIVTSGAVAAGMQVLGWTARPRQMDRLQAAASVGQSRLMRAYERLFREEGLAVGQMLLTRDIFLSPERRTAARRTLTTLLRYRVIPIVNENDAVAVEELRFGDNDQLSVLVAELAGAEVLLLLSDVDGLHDRDPKSCARSKVIPEVRGVGRAVTEIADRGRPSARGSGGMASKIAAAKAITDRGGVCVIADGKAAGVVRRVFAGEKVGTLFLPAAGAKAASARGKRA